MAQFVYIASQDSNGGILCCILTEKGRLKLLDIYPIDRPVWLCAEGKRLYALLREPFQMQSGVAAYDILENGTLKPHGDILPVHGTIAAHCLCKKGKVYTANYLSGTTTLLPDRILAHNGRGIHPRRQDCSHPHCLTVTPEGKYICINDLGTDQIYVVSDNLKEISRVKLPDGAGPRHLVFSKCGKFAYSSNELNSTVSVFSYQSGLLEYLDMYSTLPQDFTGDSFASAIRISEDGRTLYISNRGHDSVCVFDVEGAALTNQRFIRTRGRSPREIILMGQWLLCANEDSNNITIFDRNTGEYVSSFEVLRPWCILPVDVK